MMRLIFVLCIAFAAAFPASARSLRILLASDVYKMSADDGRGGHAKLAAAVRAERAKGGAFLYVHAGDAISPCLMCGFDQGEHLVALMNLEPPDVFVPGNHEFDFGKEIFLKRMKEARFPIYAANLSSPDGSVETVVKQSQTIDVEGVRVGITGVTADDAPSKSNPGDLKIAASPDVLAAEAAALRQQGADIVVGIVHGARATDLKIIKARSVDVLLSGDDHDLNWSYDGKTVFAEGGEDAQYLSVVELDINVEQSADGRKVTWSPAFRMIDTKTVAPDPDVAAEVGKYEALLSAELDVDVAEVPQGFDSYSATVRLKENFLGNMVADAIRAGYRTDIAILNGGGLRGNKVYRAGATLTRRDVLTELPFSNKVVVVELKGSDLRTVLEYGLAKLPEPSGRFPHISGGSIQFDLAAPAGARITNFKIAGDELRDGKTYRVATNDFLVRGGDGYPLLQAARQLVRPEDGRLIANELLSFLAKGGIKAVTVGDRVVAK